MTIFFNKKNARVRRLSKLRFKTKYLNIFRLVVHRTSRHIYAQVIDSYSHNILISASTLEKKIKKCISCYTGNKESAGIIGKIIAERCIKKGIKVVSFDRSGFKYHGRIKSLAESARKSGLKF